MRIRRRRGGKDSVLVGAREGEQVEVFLPHPCQWAWSKEKVNIRIVYGVSIPICVYGEYTTTCCVVVVYGV